MTTKVGIIGSGLIGRSWATLFARGGLTVVLYDNVASQLANVLPLIEKDLQQLYELHLLFEQEVDQVLKRISVSGSLSDTVANADYIQECVPEDQNLKIEIFKQLDPLVKPSVVLASSSSNLSPSLFSAELKHKNRVLVAHPVNPPLFIPVVEVLPAPYTDESAVDFTMNLLKHVKQSPILINQEVDGFVLNRLQYALMGEAFRMVDKGIASPEAVDIAIKKGLALRWSFMGPFETIDLNAPGGVEDYVQRYGPPMARVLKTQDNSYNPFTESATKRIVEYLRKDTPTELFTERRIWRDKRLALLIQHQQTAPQPPLSEKRKSL